MTLPLGRLEQYPKMAEWFLAHRHQEPQPTDAIRCFVWQTCKALTLSDEELLDSWSSAFERLMAKSDAPRGDMARVEASFASGGVSFAELLSDISEMGMRAGQGSRFARIAKLAADATNLPTYRFLAAWLALNLDRLDECVEECERVEEPFAAIYTLQGQALLELGRLKEALEVLEVATVLSPREILAWFQKAKAQHVLEDFDGAWQSLLHCQELAPSSAEVAAFLAMTACSSESGDPHRIETAWKALARHLPSQRTVPTVVLRLYELAFMARDEERASWITEEADIERLVSDPEFKAQLGWILKKLDAFQWVKVSSSFLSRATCRLKDD